MLLTRFGRAVSGKDSLGDYELAGAPVQTGEAAEDEVRHRH